MKFFVCFFIFTSCSLFNQKEEIKEIKLNGYAEYSLEDYADQLESLAPSFEKSFKSQVKKLNYSSKHYLSNIINKILAGNQNFFEGKNNFNINIIESDIPFHFSFPGGNIYFSSTLLKKYVKSEVLLYCVLSYELVRSSRLIYPRKLIYPTGGLSMEGYLQLLRLDVGSKTDLHKWSSYLLSNIGIDYNNYLTWLQVKNRNSISFIIQLGDVQSVSKEESLFKDFAITNTKKRKLLKSRRSSKSFYRFIDNVKAKI